VSDRIEQLRQAPDPELVRSLSLLIEDVVGGLDEGRACADEIAEINRLSGGHAYTREDFFELYSSTSSEDFAWVAAKGPPPAISDLTRAELVEIVEIVGSARGPETDYFVDLLDRIFPESRSSDLIFWPAKESTPEEIADELLLRASKAQ
jgi:hypothetical protein